MKTEQKLAVSGVVLVALLGGYYATRQDKQRDIQAHTAGAAKEDLPKIAVEKEKAEKITKLVVKSKDHEEVVLEKKGDKWRLTKPLDVPASASAVDSVMKNLEKLELQKVISSNADEKTFEKYELDEKSATRVQAFAGDEKLLDASFGKSGTRGQLGRIAGNASVFGVKGYSSYLFAKEVKGWRDTDVLTIEDGNAIAVEIENKLGKFSLTKSGDKWGGFYYPRDAKKGKLAEKAAKWERFEETKVKDLLTAFKSLKASDFAKDGADTGIDKATEEGGLVRLKFKDGNGDVTLKVGKKQEGDNRYLVKEGGDGTVFVVGSWTGSWAVDTLEKLSKPEEKKDGKDKKNDKDKKDDKGKPDDLPDMPDLGTE
ncbi:MAG: DUF4340 domain-containing protein [Deltaproteobacteria bacterium]|nr:DUF4340 domain-containing protein [Deltaproteobacteria bacterium]